MTTELEEETVRAFALLSERLRLRITMNATTALTNEEARPQCVTRIAAYKLVLYEIEKVQQDLKEEKEKQADSHERYPVETPGHKFCPECVARANDKKLAKPGWTCPSCKTFNEETSLRHVICSKCFEAPV